MEATLPLGTVVEFRGMKGTEEDLLANQQKVRSGEAINEILAGCTTKLAIVGDEEKTNITPADMSRMKEPERKALLIGIRRESYGDTMLAELVCDECKARFSVNVDLSTLKTKPAPMEQGTETVLQGPYDVTLEVDGKLVTIGVDYLDGRREAELAKVKENLITASMMFRIRRISDVHINRVNDWLQGLTVRKRKELRDKMAELDCGVITAITADCGDCGEENTFDVTHQPGFFFPKE